MVIDRGLSFEEIESHLVEEGISGLIQIASDPSAFRFSPSFCREKSGKIKYFYSLGLHPNEAHELNPQTGLDCMEQHKDDPNFIGVGEVGLDYYYGLEHRSLQLETLETYLEAARKYKKPVIIHTRNAHEDTLSIMKKFKDLSFLIHCFSGDRSQIKDFLDLGAFISFSGIVTFKNAEEIRQAALYCPVNQMMVETDAPYLAPTPYRGKLNRPGWVRVVAQLISELKKEEVSAALFDNTVRFFKLESLS